VSDDTERGSRFGRRRGPDPWPPAAGHDVAATIQENVRASVEESVRNVLGAALPRSAPPPGNGAREGGAVREPVRATEPVREPEPVRAPDGEPVAAPEDRTADADWRGPREDGYAGEARDGAPPPARPPVAGPLEAFLRHPFITLLPMLLLVAGAVALGVARDPEYTAKARIQVGNSSVPTFYLQTVVIGNEQLAATYARVIGAPPVSIGAAKRARIPPAQAARDLSASPVAQSTLIQVEAKGPSERYTVGLANAGAESLMAYVRTATGTGEDARTLFRQFKRAQRDTRDAEQHVQDLLHEKNPSGRSLARARLREDAARLRASELSNRYRASRSDAAQASRLTLIAPAASAESDRRDKLEQMVALAAVGGLLLGLAAALLVTNWPLLRSLRPA
jgi:hypothetical protein